MMDFMESYSIITMHSWKEYLDGKYMKSILTGSEFQTWRDDTEQYETYPDLTVDTKIGKIYAKTVPGSFPEF